MWDMFSSRPYLVLSTQLHSNVADTWSAHLSMDSMFINTIYTYLVCYCNVDSWSTFVFLSSCLTRRPHGTLTFGHFEHLAPAFSFSRTVHTNFAMYFSNELFSQIVELTLLYMTFLHDNENRLDLDKFSQVESLQEIFYTILCQCGDAIFLQSAKMYWKATTSALAMLEGQHCPTIDTPTQIDRNGPLRCLATLSAPQFTHLAQHVDDAKQGLHEFSAFLQAYGHPQSFHDHAQDCLLILDDLSHVLGLPRTPRDANHPGFARELP